MKLLDWFQKMLNGPKGDPSSQRAAGVFSLICLECVFILGSRMLILAGQYWTFIQLFAINASLVGLFFGLIVLDKIKANSIISKFTSSTVTTAEASTVAPAAPQEAPA